MSSTPISSQVPRICETPTTAASQVALDYDPHSKFWHLVTACQESAAALFEDFADDCEIDFDIKNYSSEYKQLKKLFRPNDMHELCNLMEWACLFYTGYLPGYESFERLKPHLGIRFCLEIFTPALVQGNLKWSFEQFCHVVEDTDLITLKGKLAKNIFQTIVADLREFAENETILNKLESFFNFQNSFLAQFAETFISLDLNSRFRWGLFLSILNCQLEDMKDFSPKPGIWPISIHGTLMPLIKEIELSLRNKFSLPSLIKKKKTPSKIALVWGKKQIGGFTLPLPIRDRLKPRFPQMPNWMPNAGNSDYISSSLWCLFQVVNEELQKTIELFRSSKTEKFDGIPGFHPSLELFPSKDLGANARASFIRLYEEMSSKKRHFIIPGTINHFRWSMQKADPKGFVFPNACGFEDPYKFIVHLTALMGLKSFSQQGPKFIKGHIFSKIDPDASGPIYEKALQPVIHPEFPLINIKVDFFPEHQTLEELVTKPRGPFIVERNINTGTKLFEETVKKVMVFNTEKLFVQSRESAPAFFIGRLDRFRFDETQKAYFKLSTMINPNPTLEFNILGSPESETVPYDLAAVIVHQGSQIFHSGHFYAYLIKEIKGERKIFKFDDDLGTELVDETKFLEDALPNDYLVFYKKRETAKAEESSEPSVKIIGEEDKEKVSLKRVHAVFEEFSETEELIDSTPSTPREIEVCRINTDEVEEWISKHQSLNFRFDQNYLNFTYLQELLSVYFDYEYDPEPQSKRSDRREREILKAAAQFLKRPILLVDPTNDKNLEITPYSLTPGDSYRQGEEFMDSPLFIFKQSDNSYVWLKKA